MNKSDDDFYRETFWFIIATLISSMMMGFYIGPFYTYIRSHITSSNIIPYVTMLLLFSGILVIGLRYRVETAIRFWLLFLKCKLSKIVVVFILIGVVLVLWSCYITAPEVWGTLPKSFMMYHVNHRLVAVFIGAISCVVFGVSFLDKLLLMNISKKYLASAVCGFGVLFSYTMYQPNIFTTIFNYFHADAYFNSIYNVIFKSPYSFENFSVYGYYSLLLLPFIKIFEMSYSDCIILLSFFGFISYLCMSYVLYRMIGSNLLAI